MLSPQPRHGGKLCLGVTPWLWARGGACAGTEHGERPRMCKRARQCRSREGPGPGEHGGAGRGGQDMLGAHNWEHVALIPPTLPPLKERELLKTFQNSVSRSSTGDDGLSVGDMALLLGERPLSLQLQAPRVNITDILPAVTRDDLAVRFRQRTRWLKDKTFFLENTKMLDEGMCVEERGLACGHVRVAA